MSDSSNHDDNKNHENEIIEFLTSYGVAVNKKKIRGLLSYSEQKLSSYKINIIISHCCKVTITLCNIFALIHQVAHYFGHVLDNGPGYCCRRIQKSEVAASSS